MIFNLDYLTSLDLEGRLRTINAVLRLAKPYNHSWHIMYDVVRIVGVLGHLDAPITEDETVSGRPGLDTLPASYRLKFIQLLRNISKATEMVQVHNIQKHLANQSNVALYDSWLLTQRDVDLIRRMMV